MNIFSSLKSYAGKWNLSNSRSFTNDEINTVDRAEVVSSNYGNSACFFMKSGGMSFIPMSSDSTLSVGDTIDLKNAKLLTLSRAGDADIYRVSI